VAVEAKDYIFHPYQKRWSVSSTARPQCWFP